jgi:hypothetical protein
MAPFVLPMVGFVLLGAKINRGIDAETEAESSMNSFDCFLDSFC